MVMDSKRFEDFGKMAESAMSGAAAEALALAQGLRSEAQSVMKGTFDRLANEMNLARQEDIEDIRALAVRAREVQSDILQRLDAIESRLAKLEMLKINPTAG